MRFTIQERNDGKFVLTDHTKSSLGLTAASLGQNLNRYYQTYQEAFEAMKAIVESENGQKAKGPAKMFDSNGNEIQDYSIVRDVK